MNVTCVDLVSLTFILQVLSHFIISFKLTCNLCDAVVAFECDARMAMSSAKVATMQFCRVGRSDV